MAELFENLLGFDQSLPHGHGYLWMSELVWLHAVTDALIALAYYVLLIILVYCVGKRRDWPWLWMFLLFGAYTIACGTTLVMAVWNLWFSTPWLSGGLKVTTATLALATVAWLIPLVPRALALPSPTEREALKRELQAHMLERQRAEA